MNIIVSNCHNCPFCNVDSEGDNSCNVPENEVELTTTYGEEWLPDKCPLLSGGILVGLTKGVEILLPE